jgi:hypothetical protein
MHGRPCPDELKGGGGMGGALGVDSTHLGNGKNNTGHGMAWQRHRSTVECFGCDLAGIGRKLGLNQCVDML